MIYDYHPCQPRLVIAGGANIGSRIVPNKTKPRLLHHHHLLLLLLFLLSTTFQQSARIVKQRFPIVYEPSRSPFYGQHYSRASQPTTHYLCNQPQLVYARPKPRFQTATDSSSLTFRGVNGLGA
ncbi:hypothetical protein ACQKWADRAFT_208323 [Trichoderma austrokoningii]